MKTCFKITTLKWILCILTLHRQVLGDYPKQINVSTPIGVITGMEDVVNVGGKTNYTLRTFLGIPYAETPSGNLRFRKPEPKQPFNYPFDATVEGPVCYQIERGAPSNHTRSEDCLRLNIYVPASTDGQLKPVMVWIHGGGFVNGENYAYNGSILAAFGDVIVVTVNYRLGYFGFLTTEDSNSPGNFGLWDQQLAIKWTSNNIEAFGGDSDRITLFGGSSGASSVLYQAFYPGNKGLFQRVIAQSGTMLSPWAFRQHQLNSQLSANFARAAGCGEQINTDDYMACLRGKLADELKAAMNNATVNAALAQRTPGPVLDHDFILDSPANLITGVSNATAAIEMFRSIDLMIGYNSADGMMDFFSWMVVVDCQNNDPYNFHLPAGILEMEIVPHYIYQYFNENVPYIAAKVTAEEYTDWSEPEDERVRVMRLIDLATDYYAGISTVQTALGHIGGNSSLKSTYAYEFAVRPRRVKFPLPPTIDGPEVMLHGDEINYVFGMGMPDLSEDADLLYEFNTFLATMTAWSNFAKTGNPNTPSDVSVYRNNVDVQWPIFTPNWEYLRITPVMSPESARLGMRIRAVDYWTRVLPPIMSHFNLFQN